MLSAGRTLQGAIEAGSSAAAAIGPKLQNACLSYADADTVVEKDYDAFVGGHSTPSEWDRDRNSFGAACMDGFNAMTSLPPATGVYAKFYKTAGVASAEIDEVNTELTKKPEPSKEKNEKLELGFSILLGGAPALISDGSTFTANGDYSNGGSGGQLVFNPRIGFEGAYYFAGKNNRGWKAVFGAGIELPVTSAHYNSAGMIDQYPKVGFGGYGMAGIGGTIGSEKIAFDADVVAMIGGRYVNSVVLPDSGVVSGWMGELTFAGRFGAKFKAGKSFVTTGFYLAADANIPGMNDMSFKATNSDVQEVQGRISPGGNDPVNVNGGVFLRATFK